MTNGLLCKFQNEADKGWRPVNFPLLLLLLLRLLGCPMSTTGKREKEGFSILQIKKEKQNPHKQTKNLSCTRASVLACGQALQLDSAPVFTSGYSPREEEGDLSLRPKPQSCQSQQPRVKHYPSVPSPHNLKEKNKCKSPITKIFKKPNTLKSMVFSVSRKAVIRDRRDASG